MKRIFFIIVLSVLGMKSMCQENVFWRDFLGISNFWDNGNPWFYSISGNRQRPDDNVSGTNRHNVFFENNSGNNTINVNGNLFFNLRSFNIGGTATDPRTFLQDDPNGGISIWGGIFNNSNTSHIFDVRIAIDQNNAILGADAGGLTFTREIFSNGRPIELRGNQPLLISGFISQAGGSVTKTGINTVTLSGPNTYTGLTTVTEGTLRLNKSVGNTIPVTNNITINGGNLQISTNQTINNLTFNSGTLTVETGVVLTITGVYTGGTGTIINNGRIIMEGGASQSFPGASTTVTSMNEFEVNNVSGVNMNNDLTITGSLILTNGTLNIAANNLLDLNGASLARTNGFLNGSTTSDLTIRGITGGNVSIPQNANITLHDFTIGDTRIVAANGSNNINLTGAFSVAVAAVFDNGGESQLIDGGGTVTITGRFITRDEQGFSGPSAAIPGIVPVLTAGCTIEYGRNGVQGVQSRSDYSNITFSNSGTKTLASGCNPAGLVSITGTAIFDQSNFTFGNNGTSITMSGGRYRLSGTGSKPNIGGTYSLTGGIIEFYNSAGTAQTIRGLNGASVTINYLSIEVSGSNVAQGSANITLQTSGSFVIKNGGVFTNNADAIVGPIGIQTLTIETGGKFVTGNALGFYGAIAGLNSPSVRNNIENVILQTNSTVEYSRTSAQSFTPASVNYKNIIISGGGTKTLTGAVTMEEILTLNNGLVTTDNTNLLTLTSTATCPAGGNSNSFINGPMKKIGNTTFNFPVGKLVNGITGHYRYIGLGAGGLVTDEFIAEFHRQSSTVRGWISAPAALAGLQRVSYCEHWLLYSTNTIPNPPRSVTLTWTEQSNCNAGSYVSYITKIVVVQYNGTAWGDKFGNSSSTGPENPTGLTTSTITWDIPYDPPTNNYYFFTLGSTDANENQLPFNLLSFNGNNRTSDIELAFSVKGNDEQHQYIIERSADGRNFTPLITIAAKQNLSTADYSTLDKQPLNGWNFYRLTAVDNNNRSKQSNIIRVWFGNRIGKPAIYPNPVQGNQVQLFTGGLAKGMYNVQVVGIDGKIILSCNWQFDGVRPVYSLPVPQLPAGMYYLVLNSHTQETQRMRFIK